MKSKDLILKEKQEILSKMHNAIKEDDTEQFIESFNSLYENIEEKVLNEAKEMKEQFDSTVLSSRGVRQLTSKETTYWNKVIDAMRTQNPKQALQDLDVVMPETIIDQVFDDLRESHPLLSKVNYINTHTIVKFVYNANGENKAVWGNLNDQIKEEITSSFKEKDAGMYKLTAFIPVSKDMLNLGPQWIDRYVREILMEALAVGFEEGIVTGDGKNKPIGMNRQVGDDVTVTGGVYPEKELINVTDFSPKTMGMLASKISKTTAGKYRKVKNLILVINPNDYYTKIMPSTTFLTPNGAYQKDILPIDCAIVESFAVEEGKAIFGIADRYFCCVGVGSGEGSGTITYSDEYKFLEDERVYAIKAHANGFALDNNDFLYLNIENLEELSLSLKLANSNSATKSSKQALK